MRKVFLALMLTVVSLSCFAQSMRPFEEGERVVFLGNSITEGGHYHSYIWLYYMTRFPERRIRIVNAGVRADDIAKMQKRLQIDVLDKKPTYLLLSFGMNDSGYGGYDTPDAAAFGNKMYDNAVQTYLGFEPEIKAIANINVGLIGSSPYEEVAILAESPSVHKNKNETMLRIVDFQKEQAKKNNWGFVDFNRPILEFNRQGQKSDSSFTLSGGDRVHPYNDGHMAMAYLFIRAQGFGGKKVADVEIDVTKKKLLLSENCKVTSLSVTPSNVSFDYHAQSLPYPMDTLKLWGSTGSQKDIEKHTPFGEEINNERFAIKGLEKGKYSLSIDQVQIGEWTDKELHNGINLANYSHTPQYQQALSVMHLNEERWEIETRLRLYMVVQRNYMEPRGFLFADNKEALDQMTKDLETHFPARHVYVNYTKAMQPEIRKTWENMMDLLVDRIYAINKPIVRKIELKKQN